MMMRPPIQLRPHDPAQIERLMTRLRRLGRAPMWVLYWNRTFEYPGLYVARIWIQFPQGRHTRWTLCHRDLPGIRGMMPSGFRVVPRSADDPTEIIECWM